MARVTLKMIAKEAEASIATVSMALRGQGKLAESNVSRIQEIANKLGYRPDPILASLASRRFRTGQQSTGLPLAILEFPAQKSHPGTVSQYRLDLYKHAERLGYSPHVYSVQEMDRYHDFTRVLFHRGTVGAIITGQPSNDLFDNEQRWQSYALVQCGRYRSTLPIHTVRPNIFQAIQLSFEKAYTRGYRRIGFAIGHHPEMMEDDLARLGAATAHIDQNLSENQRIPPFFGAIDDNESIMGWVKKHRPDVIISFSVALWYFLENAGIRCPEDMGFISLHLDQRVQDQTVFAGLNQARSKVAEQTILLVDQMVRHNERGIPDAPKHILIPSSWVEGNSLRPKATNDQ